VKEQILRGRGRRRNQSRVEEKNVVEKEKIQGECGQESSFPVSYLTIEILSYKRWVNKRKYPSILPKIVHPSH